ncbi:TrkH family potassium uptake protein [Acinetobacter sp. MD2(2019)]|uniref:TrkH family potassium uptake protein n=1 Tax=Acinetobacter sp. MD2(2019) TaxID=2605273 RepID=UPI002D1EB3D2|nr:potassium transporter TrkG [Acinetobacter sp. MD2(2019)]MEB3754211.1 potassium transporter TrkH [Acinetobacter sp. MD2(2019)]
MKTPNFSKTKKTVNLSPPQLLALGFLSFIAIGTCLLKLPFAHLGNLSWIDAFFTATSAVTITGLSIVPIGQTLTAFGQIVLLSLIQIGGLGFTTFAVLAALSLSPNLGLKEQLMVQNTLGQTSLSKATSIAKNVFIYTIFFEVIGTIILTILWSEQLSFGTALHFAIFYSISAFNNAGFALSPHGLIDFHRNTAICLTISSLYISGGLGFLILMDLKEKRSWKRLTTNSKLVLLTVILLNVGGFLLIWLLEFNNPKTLALMSWQDQALNAWIHATVPRSSGFNTLDVSQMTNASTLLTLFLMFIGGGSLSTAGGIKIGTFIVLVFSVITFLRRNDEIRILNHAISPETAFKALAVTLITSVLIFFGLFGLFILEPKQSFIDVLFEVVSAACTVGLSHGITANLHPSSLILLSLLMYAGRLGPLTLAYLIATPKKSRVKHPVTDIQVG